jgi:hypothetical protein
MCWFLELIYFWIYVTTLKLKLTFLHIISSFSIWNRQCNLFYVSLNCVFLAVLMDLALITCTLIQMCIMIIITISFCSLKNVTLIIVFLVILCITIDDLLVLRPVIILFGQVCLICWLFVVFHLCYLPFCHLFNNVAFLLALLLWWLFFLWHLSYINFFIYW